MTLDLDDVELARQLLADPHSWNSRDAVDEYEKAFSNWNHSEYAVAFNSGRVALSACIDALGLCDGDEVIVPGYTCVVVPNAVSFAGLKPVFCDIELETYGLDASKAKNLITPRTRAVVIHHLYGLVCRDIRELTELAHEHNLHIIEDCAHAAGAEFEKRKVGNFGHVAFFSSEQSKVFNTIQGGIAVTNSDAVAEGIRSYRDRLCTPSEETVKRQLECILLNFYKYKHPHRWWRGDWAEIRWGASRIKSTTTRELLGEIPLGYAARLAAPMAHIGKNQLTKIDRYNKLRRERAEYWGEWCHRSGVQRPVVIPESLPVFLRYPILVDARQKQHRVWARKELQVELGTWFRSPLHPSALPVENCPRADEAVRRCVNLPTLV